MAEGPARSDARMQAFAHASGAVTQNGGALLQRLCAFVHFAAACAS